MATIRGEANTPKKVDGGSQSKALEDPMSVPRQRLSLLSGAIIAVLVLFPVVGLGFALIDRPADPFTGAQVSLFALLGDSGVLTLLVRSVLLSVCVAVGSVTLGGWLAWVEHRTRVPKWWSLLTLLPLAMPSYLVAATLRSSLSQGGWLGGVFGIPHLTGFAVAALVLSVITAPLSQLIIGAALARSSASEEEAARILGASPSRVFRDITLPRLRPAVGFSGVIALLYAISDFGAVAVLDVPVLTWRLYLAVESSDIAKAAILGGATLLATLPLLIAARAIRGRGVAPGSANVRTPEPVELSRGARWLTRVVLSMVLGIGAIIPLVTLSLWVFDGINRGLEFASPWGALGDTLIAAAAGAIVTVALAWLPAAAQARRRKSGGLLEDSVYLTSALPGVLLALGLMLSTLRITALLPQGTYGLVLGSGLLLMLGYATRFLAEVYAPLKDGLSAIDQRQIDSAKVLGAAPLRRLRTVVIPAVTPGIAVALVIGFNAVVKELPVTLLLGGATGLKTLSFRVWDRYAESLWHDAGLSGLILVLLALVSAWATQHWRNHE